MEAICAREEIEFVFPFATFRHALADGPLYFERDSHPNAHAHAVAADVLRDLLIPAVSRR
jgi:hypothetical protein